MLLRSLRLELSGVDISGKVSPSRWQKVCLVWCAAAMADQGVAHSALVCCWRRVVAGAIPREPGGLWREWNARSPVCDKVYRHDSCKEAQHKATAHPDQQDHEQAALVKALGER